MFEGAEEDRIHSLSEIEIVDVLSLGSSYLVGWEGYLCVQKIVGLQGE